MVIGVPILWGLVWLHQRVFGADVGHLIGWLYIGIAASLAALARFLVHLVWEALTMKPDPE